MDAMLLWSRVTTENSWFHEEWGVTVDLHHHGLYMVGDLSNHVRPQGTAMTPIGIMIIWSFVLEAELFGMVHGPPAYLLSRIHHPVRMITSFWLSLSDHHYRAVKIQVVFSTGCWQRFHANNSSWKLASVCSKHTCRFLESTVTTDWSIPKFTTTTAALKHPMTQKLCGNTLIPFVQFVYGWSSPAHLLTRMTPVAR